MNLNKLEFSELKLVDPNADYSGTQTIFIDFDGANKVSYDNNALNIHVNNIDIKDSGLNEEEQFKIITDLNNTFADTGVTFTASTPINEEHSTIYLGESTTLAEYGNFLGLSETIDAGNQIKNDNAFIFTEKVSSTKNLISSIVHEAGHLLGFQHSDADDNSSISSYALPAATSITLQVMNNFSAKTNYFSKKYTDDEVWLYFLNTGTGVTYTNTSEVVTTVTDGTAFKLSTVKDGTFTIVDGVVSSKLYAALGTTSPFSGANGPGVFDTNIPYALLEWTVAAGANDNVDVSYIDTFAFPTTLRVKDSTGTQTGKATFKNNTTSETLITALKAVLPNVPVGPAGPNYPTAGDAAGWGPLVPTISGTPAAERWIGSSKYWQSGQVAGDQESIYLYAPSFNDYLGYLHDNEAVLFPTDNSISGWYIDYSGNEGYSFYLSVTGTDDNYGLQIHDVRHNTDGASGRPTPPWNADPTAWTPLTGTITVAANNANISYPSGAAQYDVNGNWTDITLYSGASLLDGDFTSGPIVTGTGDFATGGGSSSLNSSILASLSASIATGLLANSYYMTEIAAATPKASMYWFNDLPHDDFETKLFSGGWGSSEKFYDPFWKTMADYTDMQGYLSPFNDRWANFPTGADLDVTSSISWELGLPPLTAMATEDFKGTGSSDILFANTAGTALGYYANGTSNDWESVGGINAGWGVVGSGDYIGNGSNDILLNYSAGNQLGYYANGSSANWTHIGNYSSNWEVIGNGDFEGDGKSDILFSESAGNSLGYYADGNASNWVSVGGYNADWEVIGIGDFDGNEKSDILFSETAGNSLGYYADGNANNWVSIGGYSPGWDVVGIGDFNGNGKDDILFSNTAKTSLGYYADGSAANWVSVGGYGPGWDVTSTGDFDGSGMDDILFSETAGNSLGYYADALASNWVSVGGYSADWNVVVA